MGWDNSTNFGDNSRSCRQIPNFYEAWDVQLAANDVIFGADLNHSPNPGICEENLYAA